MQIWSVWKIQNDESKFVKYHNTGFISAKQHLHLALFDSIDANFTSPVKLLIKIK